MGREATMRRVAFTTLLLRCIFPSSPIPPLRARDRGETEAAEECMYFFLIFSPSLSFLPEQPVREERVKGDAAPYLRQPRVSPRPYLSLPAFLLPLLFYLRSKTGRTGGGTKKKRRGARLQV